MQRISADYRSALARKSVQEGLLVAALAALLFLVPLVFYLINPFGNGLRLVGLELGSLSGWIVWGVAWFLCAAIGWRTSSRTRQALDGIVTSCITALSIWIVNAATVFLVMDLFDGDPNMTQGIMRNSDQFNRAFQPENLFSTFMNDFIRDYSLYVVSFLCLLGVLIGAGASFLAAKQAQRQKI